jgi:hypothetical protein
MDTLPIMVPQGRIDGADQVRQRGLVGIGGMGTPI